MMKKINLRGISEILSEKEMKNVMGGSGYGSGSSGNCSGVGDGLIEGYWCNGIDCYIDIRWADGSTSCDCPMPTVVCTQAGLNCY